MTLIPRAVQRHQLAMVHDGDAVAQAVGLVHVMCGDQNRELAVGLDVGQHFPDRHARDRIQSRERIALQKSAEAVKDLVEAMKRMKVLN